jgi:hypothetical protein
MVKTLDLTLPHNFHTGASQLTKKYYLSTVYNRFRLVCPDPKTQWLEPRATLHCNHDPADTEGYIQPYHTGY